MRLPLFALLLAACQGGADVPAARQVTIFWPEAQRLYVGDSRQGVVKAFSTFDGPRAVAEARALGRRQVLDMRLDKTRGRLWVLAPDGLYLHEAASLVLLHRYPVAGPITAASRLSIDEQGRIRVVQATGGPKNT